MATVITISGSSVTLDESFGLQTGGVPAGSEDNNDNDVVAPSALNDTFEGRLAALSLTTFVGAARSADGFVTVSSDGTISSLGFTTATGTALPVYSAGALGTAGAASGLSAVTGGAIGLFADSTLGSRMVLGVDGTGGIVFALFLDPTNVTLTSARIEMAQFEAIVNTDASNPDDAAVLSGLGVGAAGSLSFDFNALPSGQNLFGTVGNTSSGLVVIGKLPEPSGTGYTNTSDTINTSQGGGPTTIGVDNQMFDVGDGAYFTFVQNPVADFLAGAPNGLTQGEADNIANIQYGSTLAVSTSYTLISQIQGNAAASMSIAAFNITGAPQGGAFVGSLGTNQVEVTAVRVYSGTTQVTAGITVNLDGLGAEVSGLRAGYRVEWDTSAPHDQVLITGTGGKFDIGGFGAVQGITEFKPLTNVRFEDDGPSITGNATGAPTLFADDSTLGTDPTGSFSAQFTPNFGTDGPNATSRTYALSTLGGDSGLVDVATGQAVILSLSGGGQVEGRTATDDLVFTVSVSSLGVVTLDQVRALRHSDTTSNNEAVTLNAANLVVLTGSAIDGDGDSASAPLNIGQLLQFRDDGPTISATATGAPTLSVDDSTLGTNATGDFTGQFTPVFGADGAGATPRTYALSTVVGASGLFDTQSRQAVNLSLVGAQVQGRTATDNLLVFTVDVNGSGVVTLDQIRAVKHPDTTSSNESLSLAASLVVLTGTAFDGDGDSASTPLNIGQLLQFSDDGPALGTIANSIVNFAAGSTATQSLNGVVGADVNTSPYTLAEYTPSITVNGVELRGVPSANAQEVTYWADTSGDTLFGNTGDTAYYRLTLGQDTAAGSYTFTVLVDPPPSNIPFNFDALPSGQNLFGTVGTTTTGLVVIGALPVPSGTGYTNASDTINTSQGGGPTTIGIDNQMFDAGDGAYFTFVKNPVAAFLAGAPNGLDQGEADNVANIQYTGGTLEVNTGFTVISQTQGNAAASMSIAAFNIEGAPQGSAFATALGTGTQVNITAVRVFSGTTQITSGITVNLDGLGATVSGLRAGYRVEWDTSAPHDQVLITGTGGKFDIGGFGTTQGQPTPDQMLAFQARVTDGDGDTDLEGFLIGIDGTGTFDDGAVAGVVTA